MSTAPDEANRDSTIVMTPALKSIVIGTAGHIDHGKTALIRALTGVDTDRLPEEKNRGITIDLGFASLNDTAPDGTPLRISFVDVPGHAHFIRNMLAGAGGIDAVMLVISAEEGIKPQTEEHLAICELLGVQLGVTVISKIDTILPDQLDRIADEVEAFLQQTFLGAHRSRILRVSARIGAGLTELRAALREMTADTRASRRQDDLLRLPIDRAFVMKGFGTVVTGTLISGSVCSGQTVALEAGGRTARVRGIQTHGHTEESVSAGARVALNLAGVEVSEVYRGQTIVQPDTLAATSIIDAEVTLLAGVNDLKDRARLHFHAFTAETIASMSIYGSLAVTGGSKRLARLRLREPLLLMPGDRFVLRQLSPGATIGGGRVLEAHPLTKLKQTHSLAWLEQLRDANDEQQLKLRLGRHGARGLSAGELRLVTGRSHQALLADLNLLTDAGELVRFPGDLFLSREAVRAASDEMLRRLDLATNSKGIKLSQLTSQMDLREEAIEALIERLALEHKLRRQGDLVYPIGADSKASGKTDPLQRKVEAIYEEAGLASPSTKEVVSALGIREDALRQIMTVLLREKIIVRMGAESIYIHRRALEQLRGRFRELQGQTIDVSHFKELTGLSRKYAIPLLEYLDRERVTRKEGDRRRVV